MLKETQNLTRTGVIIPEKEDSDEFVENWTDAYKNGAPLDFVKEAVRKIMAVAYYGDGSLINFNNTIFWTGKYKDALKKEQGKLEEIEIGEIYRKLEEKRGGIPT